jgi:hypothetical protein
LDAELNRGTDYRVIRKHARRAAVATDLRMLGKGRLVMSGKIDALSDGLARASDRLSRSGRVQTA